MPLPTKRDDESDDDFVKRCMDDEVMREEYPDADQRYAVCRSQIDNASDMTANPNAALLSELQSGVSAIKAGPRAGLLSQLQAEVWAMEPRRLEAFLATVTAVSAPAMLSLTQIEARRAAPRLQRRGRTAVIPIRGVLMSAVPWWLAFFGIDATSYGDLSSLIAEAAADETVEDVELQVNSPGGAVGGIQAVVDALFALDKPVRAVVDDMAASAAYWLTGTADEIAAEPNAQIGSIGVYTVLLDQSGAADKAGIKVHVIRSGEHKGAGVAGAPITAEQLANHQQVIDDIKDNFVADVVQGRRLSTEQVQLLATGAVWLAARAKELQLIDRVTSRETANTDPMKGESAMADEHTQTTAPADDEKVDVTKVAAEAAAAERDKLRAMREAFPDDLEYALNAHDQGLSVEQAKALHRPAARAEQQKAKDDGKAAHDGAEPLQQGDGERPADDDRDFLAVARQYKRDHNCTMTEAMVAVRRRDPDLHERFVLQAKQNSRPVEGRLNRIA